MLPFRAITHILIAANLAKVCGLPIEAYPLVAFGAVLPDIDTAFSPIGKRFKVAWLFGGHRVVTHSFLASFLAGAVSPFLFVGYLSHILSDSFTRAGCPLLFPFRRRFRFGFFRTGGIVDHLLTFTFIGTLLVI